MIFTDFDGCQYGLRPRGRHEHDSPENEFLKKPWTFATNVYAIKNVFNLICPGPSNDHQHVPTQGVNAKFSQYYTPYMCILLHLLAYVHFRDARAQTLPSPVSNQARFKTLALRRTRSSPKSTLRAHHEAGMIGFLPIER